jgi:alkanesulfonate monooxygenase
MKILWYLNLADGNYPWIENGLYPIDFERYRRLAQTIDRGGFFGALCRFPARTDPGFPLRTDPA